MNRGNLRVAISLHEHDSSISKKLNALMQTTNNNFQSEKFYSARNP